MAIQFCYCFLISFMTSICRFFWCPYDCLMVFICSLWFLYELHMVFSWVFLWFSNWFIIVFVIMSFFCVSCGCPIMSYIFVFVSYVLSFAVFAQVACFAYCWCVFDYVLSVFVIACCDGSVWLGVRWLVACVRFEMWRVCNCARFIMRWCWLRLVAWFGRERMRDNMPKNLRTYVVARWLSLSFP